MEMSMSMTMTTATPTMSMDMGAATATASSAAMDMSDSMGGCTISMLWNWDTVGTCFLSSSWHNTTKAMFGGSVVGVFFLCMAIELVRRVGREYDRRLLLQQKIALGEKAVGNEVGWVQQSLRGVFYGSQFSAAFLVMLLGMYYNGYILFAIFLGQTLGFILFGRDTINFVKTDGSVTDQGCCC